MKSYQKLKKVFKQLADLHYTKRIMMWDEEVMMPIGAGKYRAQAVATLSALSQKKLINKKVGELIRAAKEEGNLSFWDSANLKWMEQQYIKAVTVPEKLLKEWTKAALDCNQAWRRLRSQNNWEDFCPYLEKSFQLSREIAKRKAEVMNVDIYDGLIDDYAPGFNQKNIDAIFADLKEVMPKLKNEIEKKQSSEKVLPLVGEFPIEKQRELSLHVMKAFQFDFQHGRLDESHHPFCDGVPVDVRITTRYDKNNFLTSLFGTCHETGHALYEQGLPRNWISQPVGYIQSKAVHESQSLLWENEVSVSREFFSYMIDKIQHEFGSSEILTVDNLYKLVTRVQSSYIRVDADEVTYPLHIIVRYEIEKDLLNGNITIKDLPAYWNTLMMKYLGISTEGNYKDGVMQDLHWAWGYFGYFPSYTIGRLMAAQLFAAFKKTHSDFSNDVVKGNFQTLKKWLKENVHDYASSLETNDLLLKVTGEQLNSKYFIEGIKRKYLG